MKCNNCGKPLLKRYSRCICGGTVSSIKTKYYVWVGSKSGLIQHSGYNFKPRSKGGERLKYMGWTYDFGFPKRMNTGRILDRDKSKGSVPCVKN